VKRTTVALTKRPTPSSILARLEQACATFDLGRVDRELKKKGLTSRTFVLGAKESACLAAVSRETPYLFPSAQELLQNDPKAVTRFLYQAALDSVFLGHALREKSTEPVCSMADHFGPSPKDFRDSHLRQLLARGHFGTRIDSPLEKAHSSEQSQEQAYAPKLELAAYLISRGLNREDLLENFAPALRYEDFHVLQSKINRILDRTTPELARQFEKFWDDPKLKPAQKKALLCVYMENEDGLSQRAVAKRIRVPFETLRARVRSGLRILRKHFPKLIPLSERRPGYLTNLYKKDILMGGMLRKSGLERVAAIRRFDPRTGWSVVSPRKEKYRSLSKTPQKDFEKNRRFFDRTHYEPWFSETSLSIWGKNLTKENEPTDKARVPGQKRAEFDPLIEGTGPGLRVDLSVMPLESWLAISRLKSE
jgi:hypothetical protein